MQINLSLDSSVAKAPSNFISLLNQGVQFLEQTFANPITITIQVGWQEIAGTPLPSNVVGEAGPINGDLYTYNQVRAALAANISSAADATSVANLPSSDPTRNGAFFIGEAEEKALRLVSPTASGIDGAAGFQGTISVGVVIHELTHAMGRIDFLGQTGVTQPDVGVFGVGRQAEFGPLDLFRYVGNGSLRPTAASAYFSIDGGKTQINTYDPTDPADWNNKTNDAFNSNFFGLNVPDPVTLGDLEEMDVLGYTLANPTVTGTVLNLSSIPETVLGAPGETIIGGSGSAVINALGGLQTIIGGSGPMTVFAAAGDSVVAGPGSAYIDGSSGGVAISVGAFGTSDTIFGSVAPVAGAAPDTVTGGSANVVVQGVGHGDFINFASQSGNAIIDATGGNATITLGNGFAEVFGGPGDTINLGIGPQLATAVTGGADIVVGVFGGNDTIIGSVSRAAGIGADTLVGGGAAVTVSALGQGDVVSFGNQTGFAVVNATAGADAITLGSGIASVFGGFGNAISFGSGNQYADGLFGGTLFVVGSAGGNDTLIGSALRGSGVAPDTIVGGAANLLISGLGQLDVVNLAGESGTAVVNASNGDIAVTLGTGAASVYGGVAGSINFGTGAQVGTAVTGGATFQVGAAGSNTILGSVSRIQGVGGDTITGGAAAANISGLGQGDLVNFAGQTGTAAINALLGGSTINLGTGAASVFAGAKETVNLGSGNQYVDASAGAGAVVSLNAAGTFSVIGSTVAGSGATIKGGAAALTYNAGSGGDLVDLTGSTGTAAINGLGADKGTINDTIVAGNGGTSVFGGAGNRIGVGTNASGTDLFAHSTTINGASLGFGTNGSTANSSSAKVTVTGFAETAGNATDYIFYQGESGVTNTSIMTGSTPTTVNGAASTVITLPDGTVMTLVGVAKADFNSGFFKT